MSCSGCQLANKKENVHVVFEDNDICCILDHQPFNEGHVLLLQKNILGSLMNLTIIQQTR